jgi:hypothetical protein
MDGAISKAAPTRRSPLCICRRQNISWSIGTLQSRVFPGRNSPVQRDSRLNSRVSSPKALRVLPNHDEILLLFKQTNSEAILRWRFLVKIASKLRNQSHFEGSIENMVAK